MTKHVYYDMIIEWAKDPNRVVQYRRASTTEWIDCAYGPGWNTDYEYRFKPEPKPDIVQYIRIHKDGINWYSAEPNGKPNLCLTFSGEDDKLLKAEVIK